MKCSDIVNQLIIDGIREIRSSDRPGRVRWVFTWELLDWLNHALGVEIPVNLYYAKMRKVIKYKIVDGCPCGCRGDYQIIPGNYAYDAALDK